VPYLSGRVVDEAGMIPPDVAQRIETELEALERDTGIRAGRPGSALAAAVARCGEILAEHGVARRPGDVEELPDTLRRSEQ
jgi:hypothetical protein